MKDINPTKIWEQYNNGISYNDTCIDSGSLYDTVKQNANFVVGNQWEGVNAPDLDKPVINILKPTIAYFVSQLVSDDIGVNVEPFNYIPDDEKDKALKIISQEVDKTMEYCKVRDKNRQAIARAAIDGDACFYLTFNPDAETGQDAKGLIDVELVYNTNVYFGNPTVREVQRQPYIIISFRRQVDEVKKEAEANESPDFSSIMADEDSNEINNDNFGNKCTVLLKMWKENGKVMFCKVTQNAVVSPVKDSGYKLYPVAWINWQEMLNSYHGQAAVTGLIPNQIFINKCYAMAMDYVKKTAFPKMIYNSSLLPNGFSNRIGEAIGIEGSNLPDIRGAVAQAFTMPNMSGDVLTLIERTITDTKNLMGANDTALGNTKADNTSAIIAVQKATAAPLELQRLAFYQFVEDYIRIMLDIMRVDYGLREVTFDQQVEDETSLDMMGNPVMTMQKQSDYFDFGILNKMTMNLNVKIGSSAYFSEIAQIQTLDGLFNKGIIKDPILYLESIPDAYLPNKSKLIDSLKEQIKQQEQMAQLPQQPPQGISLG